MHKLIFDVFKNVVTYKISLKVMEIYWIIVHFCFLAIIPTMTPLISSLMTSVVDLTHELGNSSVFWPGQPEFEFQIVWRRHQLGLPGEQW